MESLFYVFVWITILYNGPHGHKRDINHTNTMLGLWAEKVIDDLDITRNAKFNFLMDSQLQRIKSKIAPYFLNVLPLINKWHILLGTCVNDSDPSSLFEAVINILDDFLVMMLESYLEMTAVLKGQQSVVGEACTVPTTSKRWIHEDMQTMNNIAAVRKRFRCM